MWVNISESTGVPHTVCEMFRSMKLCVERHCCLCSLQAQPPSHEPIACLASRLSTTQHVLSAWCNTLRNCEFFASTTRTHSTHNSAISGDGRSRNIHHLDSLNDLLAGLPSSLSASKTTELNRQVHWKSLEQENITDTMSALHDTPHPSDITVHRRQNATPIQPNKTDHTTSPHTTAPSFLKFLTRSPLQPQL